MKKVFAAGVSPPSAMAGPILAKLRCRNGGGGKHDLHGLSPDLPASLERVRGYSIASFAMAKRWVSCLCAIIGPLGIGFMRTSKQLL